MRRKTHLILTVAAILATEWWLWPIFHAQSGINLLALFLLTTFFLNHESGQIFLMLGLLLATEFKTGGGWGGETLSLALTFLIMEALGKILLFSPRNIFASFGWILLWYHLYAVLYWGWGALFSGGAGQDAIFLSVQKINPLAQINWGQLAAGTAFFILGSLFLKKLTHAQRI